MEAIHSVLLEVLLYHREAGDLPDEAVDDVSTDGHKSANTSASKEPSNLLLHIRNPLQLHLRMSLLQLRNLQRQFGVVQKILTPLLQKLMVIHISIP